MKYIAPNYYKAFSCLAGQCQHSCCIGWEIDVDEAAFQRYQSTAGQMGQRLRASISLEGGTPHFILAEGDRCPLLRQDGLCDMILQLGEDALCQICADHPRFRNYFSDRVELGLGLCCEAAGGLILGQEAPMTFQTLWEDGQTGERDPEEQALLSLRDMLLSILQDRSRPMDQRFQSVLDACGAMPLPSLPAFATALSTLERLDEGWTAHLGALQRAPRPDGAELESPRWALAFEQAAVYFLCRHLPAALDDGDVASKTAFAVMSTKLLYALCGAKAQSSGAVCLEDLVEYARMYSAEVEYSEENLQQIFSWLTPQ